MWNNPDEIDFDKLPNKFVLKCNHDSVGLCIYKDKTKFDIESAKAKLRKSLETNYYLRVREWPYKNLFRKIIAEKYMIDESETSFLRDYKFMCLNRKVKCSLVCSDRFSKKGLPKTKCYEEMNILAEKLSKGIPFVRVDFYEINGKVYFGELTFYPDSGFEEFTPRSADIWLGNFIKLPKEKN